MARVSLLPLCESPVRRRTLERGRQAGTRQAREEGR